MDKRWWSVRTKSLKSWIWILDFPPEIQHLPWDPEYKQLHLAQGQGGSIHQMHAHLSNKSPRYFSLLKPDLVFFKRQQRVLIQLQVAFSHPYTSKYISTASDCFPLLTDAVEQISCAYKENTSLWCCELLLLPGAVSPTINHSVWNFHWPSRHQLASCMQHICNLCPDFCLVPGKALPLPLPLCRNSPDIGMLQKSLTLPTSNKYMANGTQNLRMTKSCYF